MGLNNLPDNGQSETDTAGVDCRILLQQARLQAVKANLEGSFNSTGLFGIAPSLSYSHKNVFGGGEMLTLGFRGNFQFMLHDPIRASEEFRTGSILVCDKVTRQILPLVRKASGLILEDPDTDSPGVVAGISLDIPVLIGASHATAILKSGAVVTLDASDGTVTCN